MTGKSVMMFQVQDVRTVAIKEDPAGPTTITLTSNGPYDVVLNFGPEVLAKLQALLTRADQEHARFQAKQ